MRTLIPAADSPCAWRLRSCVTMLMGSRPAFSARVDGITSRASANALTPYASIPCSHKTMPAQQAAHWHMVKVCTLNEISLAYPSPLLRTVLPCRTQAEDRAGNASAFLLRDSHVRCTEGEPTTSVLAHRDSCVATSTSAAAPPAIMKRLCTRHRITHSASCSDRSASCACKHSSQAPWMVTVLSAVQHALNMIFDVVLVCMHHRDFTDNPSVGADGCAGGGGSPPRRACCCRAGAQWHSCRGSLCPSPSPPFPCQPARIPGTQSVLLRGAMQTQVLTWHDLLSFGQMDAVYAMDRTSMTSIPHLPLISVTDTALAHVAVAYKDGDLQTPPAQAWRGPASQVACGPRVQWAGSPGCG